MKKTAALFILLITSGSSPAEAVTIEIYPERTQARLGEQLRVEIKLPADDKTLKGVRLENRDIHVFSGEIRGNTAKLTIGAYGLGELDIPARIYYLQDGEAMGKSLPGFRLDILETADEGEGIRPVKGNLRIFNPLWAITAAALAGAVLILILSTGKKKTAGTLQAALSPRDEALEKLSQIRDAGLIAEGRIKEYYDAVGDCLRWYIREKHGFDALGSTLKELKKQLERRILRGDYAKITALLEECDRIKFAPAGRRPENTERVWKEAYGLIENEF